MVCLFNILVMKIVNITGGLGNQMFQYAFAIALKTQFPKEEVLIDISHFHYIFSKKWGGINLHNGYEIDKVFPNACLKRATPYQLMKVTWYMPNYLLSRIIRKLLPPKKTEYIQKKEDIFVYQPNAMNQIGDCYYEGNWESIRFFSECRDEVQRIFMHGQPNDVNLEYIGQMKKEGSVAIHVRRGDYTSTPKWSGICTLDYYKKSIETILADGKRHDFYIFSNDIPWCVDNIKPLLTGHKIMFVTENKGKDSCWDMFLMTYCQDLIIANSSFSWWGAFLNNRGGRVIAPSRWLNEDRKVEVWLDEWIKINV